MERRRCGRRLATYLNRVRGTSAKPDQIVICNGYAQGIGLLVQTLVESGAKRIALEDPSADDDALPLARAAGLDVIGLPVDEDGIRVDALDGTDADALVLTPSHQWPTGAVLSAERRAAVLRWARERQALVIEDDYDAEYRYDRAPIGAMQGLAPDLVAYAGTASKTLAPGLRLGWLVLPASLVDTIADAKKRADRGSPVVDQLALADFLERGEFDRHLRRMRPLYRRRRDALLTALRKHTPALEPAGIAAGLHLVAYLPDGGDEQAVVDAAAARGLTVHGLAPYRIAGEGPPGAPLRLRHARRARARRGRTDPGRGPRVAPHGTFARTVPTFALAEPPTSNAICARLALLDVADLDLHRPSAAVEDVERLGDASAPATTSLAIGPIVDVRALSPAVVASAWRRCRRSGRRRRGGRGSAR